MPPSVAIVLFTAIVIWLFKCDLRQNRIRTFGSWLVVLWITIGISRPIPSWFSGASDAEIGSDAYDAGNPVIRNLYLFLIVAALIVLSRRHFRVGQFVRQNMPILLLTFFWGATVLWSDYPFITLKRWIKDTGTIVMVMVLLSETDPVAALRAVLVRSSYILVPYSLLLIRYFGELGRVYSRWDGELMHVGVTTHKNMLGVVAMVGALSLIWQLAEILKSPRPRGSWKAAIPVAGTLLVSLELLRLSHSATSLVCTVVGIAIFSALRFTPLRRRPQRAMGRGAALVLFLVVLNAVVDIKSTFLELVGRDPTLTTRTEVWPILLGEQSSPILGPGFKAFWAGGRLTHLWENYQIIQAHNGYLETYLNGGLVAVMLLLLLLLTGLRRIYASLASTDCYPAMMLVFWSAAVMHNLTEASFNSFSPLWLALLFVCFDVVRPSFVRPADTRPAQPTGAAVVPNV